MTGKPTELFSAPASAPASASALAAAQNPDAEAAPVGAADGALQGPFRLGDVRALAQVMKDFELGELELVRPSGERLRLKSRRAEIPAIGPAQRPPAAVPVALPVEQSGAAAPAARPSGAAKDPGVTVIAAPLVGTFYRSPGPDAPAFVDVGQRVKKGQTLCIIEAMKLMNELESDVDGVITACLAENGRPVEYGEPLFHIKAG